MKRCPECRREYDDSMMFCLDDGAELLYGPRSGEEPATAIIHANSRLGITEPASSDPGQMAVTKSVAVLPFAHLSSDPDDEYFCDGLAEELLNALSRIDGLKVASRTSSFSYKNKDANVGEIGRALGVATVLEGSVRKSANRLRITVQLVNTADGYHLWSNRYDREMRDIFNVQDEIALAVVDALRVKLLGTGRSELLKKATVNSEAFDLYLRARAFWNKRTRAGFESAIQCLERAVELDSAYALAYVGLADCYSFLAYFEWFAPRKMAGKAKIAVEKALELAPGLAECHTAMATFKLFFEFDFAAAEHEYLAAISINPNLPQAHYLYCSALAATGRLDDAISEGQIAVSLDPISPLANMTLSRALCYAGRPEEALERIEKSLEIAPELWFLHWMLGVAYGQTGQLDRSIDHFREAAAVGGLRIYSYLGEALIRGGRPDEARRLLDELNTSSTGDFISPIAAAVIEANLGNMSRGLDLIEEAWRIRVVHLMWAGADQVFDVFRGEPRFRAICESIGLPE